MPHPNIQLVRAGLEEAPLLQAMQRQAFAELLSAYQDFETNPACETIERISEKLRQPFTYYYLIKLDDRNVGGIRVVDQGDGKRKRISPLFVLPEYQNRGVAQAAIREAEKRHGADHWSLETIAQEAKNCRLYEKAGYHPTGDGKIINDRMTLVFYEK